MKRVLLLVLIALLATLFVAPAFAASGVYVAGRAGAAALKEVQLDATNLDFDPGFFTAGVLGFVLEEGRLEVEVAYRQNAIEQIVLQKGNTFDPGGDFSALSLMLNSIVDYKIGTIFTPYIFVGAGAANISLNEDLSLGLNLKDSEDLFFVYQAGAGVGYPVTKSLTLDLEYRYFATLDTKFETMAGDDLKFDYAVHNASLGVRYEF
jgi:opacity protein-like surface antigen